MTGKSDPRFARALERARTIERSLRGDYPKSAPERAAARAVDEVDAGASNARKHRARREITERLAYEGAADGMTPADFDFK